MRKTSATDSIGVKSNNSETKKIIYTGHSGIDGNNKPTLLISGSNGILTSSRIENTILDMPLRHSKARTGSIWKFICPRIVVPLYYLQRDSNNDSYNINPSYLVEQASPIFRDGGKQDVLWQTFSMLKPVSFVWLNKLLTKPSDFLTMLSDAITISWDSIVDAASGRYVYVVVRQSKTVPAINYYGYQ